MKKRMIFFNLFLVLSLLMLVQSAFATPGASILYDETELAGGYWQYDYTFLNTSSSEYLYGVRLEFSGLFEVSSPTLGGSWDGMWGNLSPTIFMETHSNSFGDDIATGNALSGFSFTSSSQIGNTAYTAFFDDHNGNRIYDPGFSEENISTNISVVPEPISTVLFLTGGVTMAFRYRQKKKKHLS